MRLFLYSSFVVARALVLCHTISTVSLSSATVPATICTDAASMLLGLSKQKSLEPKAEMSAEMHTLIGIQYTYIQKANDAYIHTPPSEEAFWKIPKSKS